MFDYLKDLWDRIMNGPMQSGLIEERDERNLGSRSLIPISKKDLTDECFVNFDPTSIDQFDTDFCVGEGNGYVSEATEKRQGSGAYIFAMYKKLYNIALDFWGMSILGGCRVRQKWGIPLRSLWPTVRGARDFCANWKNIPQKVHDDAQEHKSEAYCQVNTPFRWSRFDSIRATLRAGREKKILIQTGNNAHNITAIGYIGSRVGPEFAKKHPNIAKFAIQEGYFDHLVAKDTYGTRTYDKGYRFIGREEARSLFTPYAQLDIPVDLAKLLDKYNGKGIHLPGSPDVYVVHDGHKRLLENEFAMWSWGVLGYPEPKDICELDEPDFSTIPDGPKALAHEGPMFKYSYQISNRLINMKPKSLEELINK